MNLQKVTAGSISFAPFSCCYKLYDVSPTLPLLAILGEIFLLRSPNTKLLASQGEQGTAIFKINKNH